MNPYQNYQNNAIMTATPGELTLMLYNGAIKFCNIAIEAIEQGNIQKANETNLRAQDIIAELQATVDLKYEVGQDMDRLYYYINQLLVEGNIEKNSNKIQQALELIREFRDAWQQILKIPK
ncbi:MAG: flagellar export chaperone FliS [Cellulosilyticaceae bacterium]